MKTSICIGQDAQMYSPKLGDSSKPSPIPSKPKVTCLRYG